MNYARITGTGGYLPEKVLTNDDLAKMVDTSDEWIAARTGIRERHVAAEGETTSDLGYQAALRALEAAGVTAADIDLIVVGTTTPDLIFPSTACLRTSFPCGPPSGNCRQPRPNHKHKKRQERKNRSSLPAPDSQRPTRPRSWQAQKRQERTFAPAREAGYPAWVTTAASSRTSRGS